MTRPVVIGIFVVAMVAVIVAADILFFRDLDLDMIGMGPYIPHHDTPLGRDIPFTPDYAADHLRLGLNMIAATRLYLHDVNIAATTALQALPPTTRLITGQINAAKRKGHRSAAMKCRRSACSFPGWG